jgi:hypothetical protein
VCLFKTNFWNKTSFVASTCFKRTIHFYIFIFLKMYAKTKQKLLLTLLFILILINHTFSQQFSQDVNEIDDARRNAYVFVNFYNLFISAQCAISIQKRIIPQIPPHFGSWYQLLWQSSLQSVVLSDSALIAATLLPIGGIRFPEVSRPGNWWQGSVCRSLNVTILDITESQSIMEHMNMPMSGM